MTKIYTAIEALQALLDKKILNITSGEWKGYYLKFNNKIFLYKRSPNDEWDRSYLQVEYLIDSEFEVIEKEEDFENVCALESLLEKVRAIKTEVREIELSPLFEGLKDNRDYHSFTSYLSDASVSLGTASYELISAIQAIGWYKNKEEKDV